MGVEHEVLRQCWSTDWSIGRRYVARYESTLPPGFILGHSRAIHQGSVDHAVDAVRAAILRRDSGSARAVHSLQVSEFVVRRGDNSHSGAACLEGIRLVAAVAAVQSRDSTSERDWVAQGAKIYTEKHMQILDCLTSLMLDTTLGLRSRRTFSVWRSVSVVHHRRS